MYKYSKIKIKYETNIGLEKTTHILEVIPLACFTAKVWKYINEEKHFLWFKRKDTVRVPEYKRKWLVYIPWKHCQKQIELIDESDIISAGAEFPSNWINVSQYISTYIYAEECPSCREDVEITNFCGYDFIYNYNSFVATMIVDRFATTDLYEELYKHMPELISEELVDEPN